MDKLGVSESLILMTDKFASGERHNKWEIMSAPTQVGVSGDGGAPPATGKRAQFRF